MKLSEFVAEFPLLDAAAGADLADIAAQVQHMDRKGSLTLKVSVEKKGGRVMTQLAVDNKPPKDDPEAGLFFVHPDKGLTKDDPWQTRLDQVDPVTGEIRLDD